MNPLCYKSSWISPLNGTVCWTEKCDELKFCPELSIILLQLFVSMMRRRRKKYVKTDLWTIRLCFHYCRPSARHHFDWKRHKLHIAASHDPRKLPYACKAFRHCPTTRMIRVLFHTRLSGSVPADATQRKPPCLQNTAIRRRWLLFISSQNMLSYNLKTILSLNSHLNGFSTRWNVENLDFFKSKFWGFFFLIGNGDLKISQNSKFHRIFAVLFFLEDKTQNWSENNWQAIVHWNLHKVTKHPHFLGNIGWWNDEYSLPWSPSLWRHDRPSATPRQICCDPRSRL